MTQAAPTFPLWQRLSAFAVFVLWAAMLLHYSKAGTHLHQRPQGEHLWAQADRASVALTYAQDGNSFWEPHVHLTNGKPEGITAGELPLLPYSASRLYKWLGFDEYLHRMLVLCLSMAGWLFAFLLARRWVPSPGWAAAAGCLFIISPNLSYYSLSFLPDTSALTCLLIACWFLFHPQVVRWQHLIGFSAFFAVGALLKLSAALPVLAILAAWLATEGRGKLPKRQNKLLLALSVAVPLLLTAAWVAYARRLTQEGGVFVFLLEPLPPRSLAEALEGLREWGTYLHYYYPPATWVILAAGTVAGLVFLRKSRVFLLLGALLCYLAYFAFFFLLFDKAPTHHYYTVPFQVGVLLHLCWLGDLAAKMRLPHWAAGLAAAAGMVLLNVNAIHAGKNAHARFSHDMDFSIFNDLEPQLAALKIRYEDRVLSYDDFSFNISLYLMNRKGVTLSPHSNEAAAEAALSSCNYAVLTDTALLSLPRFRERIGPPIGRHKTLTIHAILPPPR